MIDNPDFKFLIYGYGSSYQLLKSSPFSLHRRIFDRISRNEEESLVRSHAESIDRLTDGAVTNTGSGIVMEGTKADFFKSQLCGFYTVGHLDERIYAFAFPKGSPLASSFSKAILNLEETGALQVLISPTFLYEVLLISFSVPIFDFC